MQQPVHSALLRRWEFADPRLQVGDDLPHRAEPQFAIFYTRDSKAPVIQPEQLAVFGRDAQPAVLSDPDKTWFVTHDGNLAVEVVTDKSDYSSRRGRASSSRMAPSRVMVLERRAATARQIGMSKPSARATRAGAVATPSITAVLCAIRPARASPRPSAKPKA